MARVLAVSSMVVRGHVGNAAAVPVLQCLGHEVWSLPTVVLSNHPGHRRVGGVQMDAGKLEDMIEALGESGWLDELDAVLTGYLPSAAHVLLAARLVRRLKASSPRLLYLCDPALGDDPKGVYVAAEAAAAIRDELIGLADITTPNRFELAWLAGVAVADVPGAIAAAAALGCAEVLVTSVPDLRTARLVNVLATPDRQRSCPVPAHPSVPHGTGDMLAALYLGHRLAGRGIEAALGRTVAGVRAVVEASVGRDELALVAALGALADMAPDAVDGE
ncbi:MAG: pyridoxal kinase [Hyphomicrobiaceae bacterium]|nr:pyridoxal kinase [Hyphomicrobiaceae bacterium]